MYRSPVKKHFIDKYVSLLIGIFASKQSKDTKFRDVESLTYLFLFDMKHKNNETVWDTQREKELRRN